MSKRHFLKSAADSRNSVREVLELLFASELLRPSRCVWVVSAWLRDIPVLDNRTGAYVTVCPDLPPVEVRLGRVLRELMDRGTRVVVVTRPDEGNLQLFDMLQEYRASKKFLLDQRSELHAKGIVTDHCCLLGSMNLTYNGLERLTEMLVLETDPAHVQMVRLAFQKDYGGLDVI